jgi:hypothetical protein
LFGYHIVVEPVLPELDVEYHHKDRDPEDLISYVIVEEVEDGTAHYRKFYKDNSPSQVDTISVREFNRWFRKGL